MPALDKLSRSLRRLAFASSLAIGALLISAVSVPTSTAVLAQGQVQQSDPTAAQQGAQNAPSADVRATLSQFGTFVQHSKYGEVWTPSVTPQGWHPYEACHWVNTKKYGWYFEDKRPWGQIVHHYGRWTHDDQMGWVWVPGAEFSPGWVVWRSSPQWIGWAPQMPDEDLTTVSADQFNNGGFWTFMEVAKFDQGCNANAILPAQQIQTVLRQTQFVTEIDYYQGIAIFVLPPYIVGPLIEIEVDFIPWSPAFYFQLLIDLNAIFNDFNAIVDVNFVDCTKPLVAPAVYTPPTPSAPAPPPQVLPPAPRPLPPPVVQNRCPDGSSVTPGVSCASLPRPLTCPRGSHPEGSFCVANVVPSCPDDRPRDVFGQCRNTPPPFVCPNGSRPDPLTGACPGGVITVTCQPPKAMRDGVCVDQVATCPGGARPDSRGQCPSVPTGCVAPKVIHDGVCIDQVANCPGGARPDGRGQCPPLPVPCIAPKVMRDGVCVDQVASCPGGARPDLRGQCPPLPAPCIAPKVMRGGVCVDQVASCPGGARPDSRGQCPSLPEPCIAPKVMRNGMCVDQVASCPGGARPDSRGQCSPLPTPCVAPKAMRDGVCVDRVVTPTCVPPKSVLNGRCVDRVAVTPACLPPKTIVNGHCVDRVVQPTCASPRTMRGGQCVDPILAQPTCTPPQILRGGRCVAGIEPRADSAPSGHGPNGPFDTGVRHPSYGNGPNGNPAANVTQRPPVLPVIQRPPVAVTPNAPTRSSIVLSRGGGGQNVFNQASRGPARMTPQPVMHPMPSMPATRGGGGGIGGAQQIR